MYAISFFVGSKFGGWIVGKDRFKTQALAHAYAIDAEYDEHIAGASKFLRRVVLV